jgi:alkanesulfonate monooxygenase SsuD/methylene tetrahydromethanopterin reductase-like flavin-dependent oxidoreductase (luciferase family)
MTIAFGLFDHLDYRFEPPHRTYADRLELIRAAEQAGFRAWHLAEHHGTPLGLAASPNVFLAAAARATSTIRLGAMVYCLPLYHPLRLLEEICMLDQLSEGRVEVGVGRGASPFEARFYGVDASESVERYVEALAILRAGLAAEVLSFTGRFYRFDEVPLPIRPVQQPVPFWSAPASEEAQRHALADGMHIMTIGPNERVRNLCASYRRLWQAQPEPGPEPWMGACRLVVVGDDDARAQRSAEAAFATWFGHLSLLWRQHNASTPILQLRDFGTARELGAILCGDARRVADELGAQIESCGYNYGVLQFAFGDLGHAAEMRSLELFAERVMPVLACASAAAV